MLSAAFDKIAFRRKFDVMYQLVWETYRSSNITVRPTPSPNFTSRGMHVMMTAREAPVAIYPSVRAFNKHNIGLLPPMLLDGLRTLRYSLFQWCIEQEYASGLSSCGTGFGGSGASEILRMFRQSTVDYAPGHNTIVYRIAGLVERLIAAIGIELLLEILDMTDTVDYNSRK